MKNEERTEVPKRIIRGSSLKFKKPSENDQKNFDIFLGIEEEDQNKPDDRDKSDEEDKK